MRRILLLAAALMVISVQGAGFLERLGIGKRSDSSSPLELSEDQVIGGLKEALAKGVEHAITNLGRTGGFLQDIEVRIPAPPSAKRELGFTGESIMDDLIVAMNRAAEQAVPHVAEILRESVRSMTIEDARKILASANTAATDYFRGTVETNLYELFLPIVKSATAQRGVATVYKQMMDKLKVSRLPRSRPAWSWLDIREEAPDLDVYVTIKALDALFLRIGEEEGMIRKNPSARTTPLLRQVFGSLRE